MSIDLPPVPLLVVAALFAAAAMAACWVVQRRRGDAGLIDLVWTLGFAPVAVFFAVASDAGHPLRRGLVAALVVAWSARLAVHLAARLRSGVEDSRYADLRREKGDRFQAWMLAFHAGQALSIPLLAISHLFAMRAPAPPSRVWDLIALAVFGASLALEALADRQLRDFRADPANRGRVCDRGLWAWSRHPNYFFEWTHWLAWPLFAIGAPGGGAAWIGPAVMLLLLRGVTGVPPIEARARATKGAAWRAYERRTSAFLPLPPRDARRAGGAPSDLHHPDLYHPDLHHPDLHHNEARPT